MQEYVSKVKEAASFLKQKVSQTPKLCIFTGTGLGNCIDIIKIEKIFQYNQIPNFSVSTVKSHTGRLIFGSINDCKVVAMEGRFHLYEGYSALEVSFPVRVMQELGVKVLIVSNASGGLNLLFKPGDIMVIKDHINLTSDNPLIGKNEDAWGIRFPDMVNVYDKNFIKLAFEVGKEAGINLQSGVYAGLKGPSLETPAETRFLKIIGSDAVGFSTVTEVIAAVHAGMKILGLAIISNINDPDNPVNTTLDDIIDVANNSAPKLEKIIQGIARRIDDIC